MSNFQNQEWLKIEDVEKIYGISKHIQARLRMKRHQIADKNPIPFSKVGKQIRYRKDRIEAWLLAKENENYSQKEPKKILGIW